MDEFDPRAAAEKMTANLVKLSNWLRHQFYLSASKNGYNLTPAQFNILFLIRKSQPCTMTDLSTHSFVSRSSLTTMLNKLVDAGLVERHLVPADRRLILVRLTSRGGQLLTEVETRHIAAVEDRLVRLTEPNQRKLTRLLQDIGELMEDPELCTSKDSPKSGPTKEEV